MANNEAKQKAKELIEWFMPLMYCYMGSGMLSNTYDYKVALDNAKQCAIKVCDEIIDNNNAVPLCAVNMYANMYISDNTFFYKQVKKEIENYEQA